MLPMAVGNEPNGNYLEFYQGFLLGLDSVRTKYGHSIDLTLYNTARNVDAIREFVKSDAFAGTGLIVGPVYEEGSIPSSSMPRSTTSPSSRRWPASRG